MIPFDFEYYRPDSLREAAELFGNLEDEGKNPAWYGGGSELLSMARMGNAAFGAVVDIKGIPECRGIGMDGENLTLGASLTLSDVIASDSFPLLGKTAGRIADHTMQNKITLGGNLASTIIYRETALPLLLGDAVVTAAGKAGVRRYSIHDVFDGRLKLPGGEFLVRASIPAKIASAPYLHQKKTKNEKLDYPLLTAAAVVVGGRLRVAFSGLATYPFRDRGAEDILNDGSIDTAARADRFVKALSGVIQDDLNGSAGYRRFILKDTVMNILRAVREERLVCSH